MFRFRVLPRVGGPLGSWRASRVRERRLPKCRERHVSTMTCCAPCHTTMCRTLRRCLACTECWDWNSWRGCTRCMSHGDYGQATTDAVPAADATTSVDVAPSADPLITAPGATHAAPPLADLQYKVSASLHGKMHVSDSVAALHAQASMYPQLAQHGPTVSDYDAFCNHALKHGVVRGASWCRHATHRRDARVQCITLRCCWFAPIAAGCRGCC